MTRQLDECVVGRVRCALAMLRDPTSTARLVQLIPAAVAVLGFDRAVYGPLVDLRWRPVAAFGGFPEEEPEVVVDRRFAEHGALVALAPVVVDETAEHRLLSSAWCRRYLVVPVVERGVVLGLVSAGHHDSPQTPGAVDRELLWTFAEAVGACFASARAVDVLRDLVTRMTEVAGEFGGPAAPGGVRELAPVIAPAALTARELQVLELMAAGQTNGQIARRLVITEGTAKSHVKRIMRKLRAANRAEAVAAWIRPDERVLVGERR